MISLLHMCQLRDYTGRDVSSPVARHNPVSKFFGLLLHQNTCLTPVHDFEDCITDTRSGPIRASFLACPYPNSDGFTKSSKVVEVRP